MMTGTESWPADERARYIDWETFWKRDRADDDWLIEPVIAAGQSVALYAAPGAGKSLLALELAVALATGTEVLGHRRDPLTVLYVDWENAEDDLHDRLTDLGHGPTSDLSRLRYSLLADWEPLDTADGGQQLYTAATNACARLVVIDTLSRAVDGPENDSDTVRALYRHSLRPLKAAGIAVLRLDHSGKDNTKGMRGSSAKGDDVDTVFQLLPRTETALTLKRDKTRTGRVPEYLHLRRESGPLRHVLDQADTAFEAEVEGLIDRMDALGLPSDVGRPTAAKALKEAGTGARNATLQSAVSRRKLRAVPTVPTPTGHLSPAVPAGEPPEVADDCPQSPPLYSGDMGTVGPPDDPDPATAAALRAVTAIFPSAEQVSA